MARARSSPRTAPAEEAPRSLIWLQGLICGGVATLATPSAFLGGVLLAPAILAYKLDREPGHPLARAILVCTLAGAIHPLFRLWLGRHTLALASLLLSDPWTYAAAWGAAAGAWALAELIPVLVRAALEVAAISRATRLRAQRAQLEREWGIPPATADG
jgi:hypothetical protein